MKNYNGPSGVLTRETNGSGLFASGLGYAYTYDTRRTGLNPNAGVLLTFGQDFYGLGGDMDYIETKAKMVAQTRVWYEEVTLRATLEGGALSFRSGQSSRAVDRYKGQIMRGFEPNGIGPTETNGANVEHLGGDMYAVLKLDAEFPLGLPDEFGITGGAFYDIGAIWDLNTAGAAGAISSKGFEARQTVGVSLIWQSPFGPLRFNWSTPLDKQPNDRTQNFDVSIATSF